MTSSTGVQPVSHGVSCNVTSSTGAPFAMAVVIRANYNVVTRASSGAGVGLAEEVATVATHLEGLQGA